MSAWDVEAAATRPRDDAAGPGRGPLSQSEIASGLIHLPFSRGTGLLL